MRDVTLNPGELYAGTVRENLNNAKDFAKTEDYLEPLRSVGEITGEVLCPCGNEHCEHVYATKRPGSYSVLEAETNSWYKQRQEMTGTEIIGEVLRPVGDEHFIVEVRWGPSYCCRSEVEKEKLTSGARVVLDMTTSTIMRMAPMPKKVDPVVLRDQMRLIRELVELPLRHPELFRLVGVKPPGVNSTDIASILFGELQPPSLLQTKHRPKQTYREMPPRHHRTSRDRRWQWQR